MGLQRCFYATLTLITTLHVPIIPKKVSFYSKKGKSKSFSPTDRLNKEDTDMEQDPAYVPPGTSSQTTSVRVTRGTPQKVGINVVTAS